ncbi:hypothetical protein TIFTF001_053350 [Ficus carica]|uniref:Uncharacterized protein n=1 Tax=Ficus carica TaxID=3494 RepID=A0AA88EB64_FICCA|nr:hypothetical protein TIFTF001_053350 [Ficus carica]
MVTAHVYVVGPTWEVGALQFCIRARFPASLLHFASHRFCKCPRLLHPVKIIAGNSCPHKENVGYRDG